MSVAGFEEFANTVSASSGSKELPQTPALSRISVLGGGDDARMYAALALADGKDVTLFSAYGAELSDIRAAGSVTLRGEGPIGSFHVDQPRGPSITTTSALDDAVGNADAIILTGPLHKQRTYAMVLADHLGDDQVLVLPNARSLGAVEVAWLLQSGGCSADVTIVEIGGAPFWVSRDKSTLVLSACAPVPAAVLPQGREATIDGLKGWFPNAATALSCVHSGFSDATGAVEIPALAMGGPAVPDGTPHVQDGGVPLAENHTFRTLIGPAHESMIAKLWAERCAVASDFGVRGMPDASNVIAQVAGTPKGAGARPVPTEAEAREALRAGVIGSLIPLVSAAELTGRDVPATRAMIEMAMTVLERDLCGAGRRLGTIGVTATDVSAARRQFDQILNGGVHG
ncbi:hypothetical protein [Falsiphaeobacter marinintestinus]|uniref:hypothetical protein n=1 Tax=Falsiphaeobacter marinintestinus TaxID=1492905 RepID=UPI0011B7BF10|nr:hypothetical protein [Phaeobacter marinintestinus]